MAAIFFGTRYTCSGAIITERHILSAGHCFVPNNGQPITAAEVKVALGILFLRAIKDQSLLRNVNKISVYPKLQYDSVNGIIVPLFDIGLLQLESKVTFTRYILPLTLPRKDEEYINYTATLAGWGATYIKARKPSNILLSTTVKIIDYETCLESDLRRYFSSSSNLEAILCAFGGTNDGCKGDSGAPLIVRGKSNVMKLAGIMSWGVGCGDRRYPAVYTKTSYFVAWIHRLTLHDD